MWEESGEEIPFYPGSYLSPSAGDESWKSLNDNVKRYFVKIDFNTFLFQTVLVLDDVVLSDYYPWVLRPTLVGKKQENDFVCMKKGKFL